MADEQALPPEGDHTAELVERAHRVIDRHQLERGLDWTKLVLILVLIAMNALTLWALKRSNDERQADREAATIAGCRSSLAAESDDALTVYLRALFTRDIPAAEDAVARREAITRLRREPDPCAALRRLPPRPLPTTTVPAPPGDAPR